MNAPAKPKTAITPTREDNYPEWYQQVVKRRRPGRELADVRGCMVIKPWGYALWENMQRALDGMFKATGHVNAYFPLFIPMSFLEKEAEHVEGFAKECAVVTHHRLEAEPDGKLRRSGRRARRAADRPADVRDDHRRTFAKWVQSYRDLPLLINQWATSCAGRCARGCSCARPSSSGRKATPPTPPREEAREETMQMLDVYADVRRGLDGDAGDQGREDGGRAVPRRGAARSASKR